MWNNKPEDEDDSWEVRAFKEDTTRVNLMGCTWPPPSYNCTFCWREFRSAQALGGHMNVHRRDRAKLHVAPAPVTVPPSPSEIVTPNPNIRNGLCLIYTVPNPSGVLVPTCAGTIEQFHVDSMAAHSFVAPSNSDDSIGIQCDNEISANEPCTEELDLELRLGPKSLPPGKREDKTLC